MRITTTVITIAICMMGCTSHEVADSIAPSPTPSVDSSPFPTKESEAVCDSMLKSEDEWRASLTPEQYRVMRQKGTEPAFSGKYYKTKTKGVYTCAACGSPLFSSDAKFDSGTGWPSFWEPVAKQNVKEQEDLTHGMVRTEVLCSRCSAHLGHVFEDGPKPTGLRYCINSTSLELNEDKKD